MNISIPKYTKNIYTEEEADDIIRNSELMAKIKKLNEDNPFSIDKPNPFIRNTQTNNYKEDQNTMAKEETNKLTAGTWATLKTGDFDKKPKVSFEVNIPVIVQFKEDEPIEMVGQDGGVYYMFEVIVNGQDTIIQTSAWTLLRALKALVPLKGKKVTITKKLEKGKQHFEVIEVIG